MRSGWNDVPAEKQGLFAVGDPNELKPDGVALEDHQLNARVELGLTFQKMEATTLFKQPEVLCSEATRILFRRRMCPFPLSTLHVVGGVGERQGPPALFAPGRSTRVVEVQVSQHHIGDLTAIKTGARQLVIELGFRVLNRVDAATLVAPVGSNPGIHQNQMLAFRNQQATNRERNPVLVIGAMFLRPKRLRNHPEHRPSVEREGGDVRGDSERSEEHTSELQSRQYLVCRLLLEKKNKYNTD